MGRKTQAGDTNIHWLEWRGISDSARHFHFETTGESTFIRTGAIDFSLDGHLQRLPGFCLPAVSGSRLRSPV